MKKLLAVMICAFTLFAFVGCSGNTDNQNNSQSSNQSSSQTSESSSEPETPPDLTGEWTQANKNSEESYQVATIQGDTIEVYWFDKSTDTKSLYWAGTFTAPTTADEPYTWDSEKDEEKTENALLASGDDTKTFTYQDNQISYSVSALGTTQTVKLEKE